MSQSGSFGQWQIIQPDEEEAHRQLAAYAEMLARVKGDPMGMCACGHRVGIHFATIRSREAMGNACTQCMDEGEICEAFSSATSAEGETADDAAEGWFFGNTPMPPELEEPPEPEEFSDPFASLIGRQVSFKVEGVFEKEGMQNWLNAFYPSAARERDSADPGKGSATGE